MLNIRCTLHSVLIVSTVPGFWVHKQRRWVCSYREKWQEKERGRERIFPWTENSACSSQPWRIGDSFPAQLPDSLPPTRPSSPMLSLMFDVEREPPIQGTASHFVHSSTVSWCLHWHHYNMFVWIFFIYIYKTHFSNTNSVQAVSFCSSNNIKRERKKEGEGGRKRGERKRGEQGRKPLLLPGISSVLKRMALQFLNLPSSLLKQNKSSPALQKTARN